MTASAAVTLLIKTFALLSVFLLIGTFLRAKIRFFQNLYLPACVIGGFLALIFGPNLLNIIPISEDMMSAASALPGILFTPVIVALPMCSAPLNGTAIKKQKGVLVLTAILCLTCSMQFGLGLLVNSVFSAFGVETYRAFGLELAMGYVGGHGQAGAAGNMLDALNQPYWETAQGMVSTTATVGMIGGLVIGTLLINVAAKRGYTSVVKNASSVSAEMRIGFFSRNQPRPDMGTQTAVTNNIETLTLHLGVLLVATGGGYILAGWVNKLGLELLGALATWFYAMAVMYVIWFFVCKFNLEHLFDEKVKNTITGLLSDYLIIAAIMTIPIEVIAAYWVPLVVMCALGLVVTPALIYFLCKKYAGEYWFEKCLGPLGCCHGVFVTGMLLIKMADPDIKTPALNDYSLAYTLHNFYIIPLLGILYPFVVAKGATVGSLACMALAAVFFVLTVIFGRSNKAAG